MLRWDLDQFIIAVVSRADSRCSLLCGHIIPTLMIWIMLAKCSDTVAHRSLGSIARALITARADQWR
jgi:hypothetical protein